MKYQLHPGAAFRRVGEEVFVVTDDRALHQFSNATATAVFAALSDAPKSIAALADTLNREFEVDQSRAAADVERFMTTLVERRIAAPVGEAK